MHYRNTEALRLASNPHQRDEETVVQYQARFKKIITYLEVARNLDDVIHSFLKGLISTLVGGASLLPITCKSWFKFVGAIANLGVSWEGPLPRLIRTVSQREPMLCHT